MVVLACKHSTETSRASGIVFEPRWWKQQLADPLHWFGSGGAEACKNSHSGQVRRAVLEHGSDAVPVIIKRPLARNWRRAVAQLLRTSRSRRGWRIGHALLHRDIPAARPLAVLERRLGPLTVDSLLITEALPGGVDLETLLRRAYAEAGAGQWVQLKRELTPLVARELRRLHENGFEHHDCKASNILVQRYPRPALQWIDMDGIRLAGRRSATFRIRALVRLHVSLMDVPGLTRTDRVRFLKLYLQRYGAPPDEWRRLWSALSALAARKARAKEARRAWKRKHYGRE
jgi:tRNA A-37 threonylcarbamoyl transferase component Bud32